MGFTGSSIKEFRQPRVPIFHWILLALVLFAEASIGALATIGSSWYYPLFGL